MVGEEACVPSQGVGGNGIASEFGDLTGMTRQEVDEFLRGLVAKAKFLQEIMLNTNFLTNQKS
ncbi:MAG: hypothetical protein HC789_14435 [Microcoleus sp. CSU_2_2]|nr:hypothetical protein [Microcoleus sp. CSU_2_2]